MQLYISPTSPYARKAWMVALEKGLAENVEIIPVNPWESPRELIEKNPLSQVPVLAIDQDQFLYDSRVICAYLDHLRPKPLFVPEKGFERIAVLRMEALADGLCDVAVSVFFARKDTGDAPDTPAIERQLGKIIATLEIMEGEVQVFAGSFSLGTIAYGAALSYLDLRYGELDWRGRAPKLADWFATIEQRPAMIGTAPSV